MNPNESVVKTTMRVKECTTQIQTENKFVLAISNN